MADIIRDITQKLAKKNKSIDDFKSGDTVGVYVRIREGDKDRVQLYKGVVLKIQGSGAGRSFTVRKISAGVGVERTFPFSSPALDRVELVARGKVRRSRLYFLRNLKGKAARLTSVLVGLKDESAAAKAEATPAAE
jgi:large subunit ribosomal protein L19